MIDDNTFSMCNVCWYWNLEIGSRELKKGVRRRVVRAVDTHAQQSVAEPRQCFERGPVEKGEPSAAGVATPPCVSKYLTVDPLQGSRKEFQHIRGEDIGEESRDHNQNCTGHSLP